MKESTQNIVSKIKLKEVTFLNLIYGTLKGKKVLYKGKWRKILYADSFYFWDNSSDYGYTDKGVSVSVTLENREVIKISLYDFIKL